MCTRHASVCVQDDFQINLCACVCECECVSRKAHLRFQAASEEGMCEKAFRTPQTY